MENNIISGKKYRITMLTQRLVRLEYSENGVFEDRPTQAVINRDFGKTEFTAEEKNGELIIETPYLKLTYNKKEFSNNGLSIKVLGNCSNYRSTWYYGDDFMDLGGTARTLDKANGSVPLSKGLISKNGFSVYDDSKSLVMTDDGFVKPRENQVTDIYFFGYGHDYKSCIKDFYHLCGSQPLLPRYALGNWWSRYYKYTQQSYMELIEKFENKGIPFSVSVLDMDWHLVDIDPKYGSGWTGYTWNRELFPDPKAFMTWLHEKGLKITLNVHPAAGARAFEDNYKEMAQELGVDWEKEETIEFDISDKKFLDAYFKYLHHPNEEMGVDFWWIDWQQQSHTKTEGLDPLWMLNHFHYLDSGREGKTPLTFSRYAGIGSHRYPIGFSGDTYITWDSLDFQPYFTSTASNVGYGWWSHDIGGHMHGYRDSELQLRWIQYGVFSPINRLHCSDNIFCGKEPWNYDIGTEIVMTKFLRLRHKLVPYLYTMNVCLREEGRPLILPMYYEYPEAKEAYNFKNQYYFGKDMIVCPITSPSNKKSCLGKVTGWLPSGCWYDIFTGTRYKGGMTKDFYRNNKSIPVFAKAGTVLPLSAEVENSAKNPESFEVLVFAGDSGSFKMIEDKDEKAETRLETEFVYSWGDAPKLTISASGCFESVPENRRYSVKVYGQSFENASVLADGKPVDYEVSQKEKSSYTITLPYMKADTKLEIVFGNNELAENPVLDMTEKILNMASIEYDKKLEIFTAVKNNMDEKNVCASLLTMKDEGDTTVDSIVELICAQ